MKKQYLIVANWKMQLPFNEMIQLCKDNLGRLVRIASYQTGTIVLCPSFVALSPIAQLLSNTPIKLGAQTVSNYQVGAYTGDVSAVSLAQIGCTYCIIGHSERRTHFGETSSDAGAKAVRLIENSINPIICVGETKAEYDAKKTLAVLQSQLDPVLKAIHSCQPVPKTIIIAYEPAWSIGTGIVPDASYLHDVFAWLQTTIKPVLSGINYQFIYGGSVTDSMIETLKAVPGMGGVLVGGASLDFQKFDNIVSLLGK